MPNRARLSAARQAAYRLRRRGYLPFRGELSPELAEKLVAIGILEPGDIGGSPYDLGAALAMGLGELDRLLAQLPANFSRDLLAIIRTLVNHAVANVTRPSTAAVETRGER